MTGRKKFVLKLTACAAASMMAMSVEQAFAADAANVTGIGWDCQHLGALPCSDIAIGQPSSWFVNGTATATSLNTGGIAATAVGNVTGSTTITGSSTTITGATYINTTGTDATSIGNSSNGVAITGNSLNLSSTGTTTITGSGGTTVKGGTNSGTLNLNDGNAMGGTNITISGSGGGTPSSQLSTLSLKSRGLT